MDSTQAQQKSKQILSTIASITSRLSDKEKVREIEKTFQKVSDLLSFYKFRDFSKFHDQHTIIQLLDKTPELIVKYNMYDYVVEKIYWWLEYEMYWALTNEKCEYKSYFTVWLDLMETLRRIS